MLIFPFKYNSLGVLKDSYKTLGVQTQNLSAHPTSPPCYLDTRVVADHSQFSSEWSGQSTWPLQNLLLGRQSSPSRQSLLPVGQCLARVQWVAFRATWSWAHLQVAAPGTAKHRCWQFPLFTLHWLVPARGTHTGYCTLKNFQKMHIYCICHIPVWLDLLYAFKSTTAVLTSNHICFCCRSSRYHSLVLSRQKTHCTNTATIWFNKYLQGKADIPPLNKLQDYSGDRFIHFNLGLPFEEKHVFFIFF